MSVSEFAIATAVQSDQRTPNRWVLSHIFRHKPLIAVLLLGAFGNAALAAAVPVFIGIAFNAVLATPANYRLLAWSAVGIVLSQLLRSLLQFGRNFASEVIGQRLERDTREELYLSLLGKSMTFHDLQPVGDTMARATNDVREVGRMLNPGLNLVIGSGYFLIMPALLAPTYDWQLLFSPLFFIVTYIFALWRYLRSLNPVADRVRLTFGLMNSRLAEAIDGIETVKGAAQEDQEIDYFSGNAAAYRDASVTQGHIEARFLPLLLMGITNAIGFSHALILFQAGRIDVGDVIAYTALLTLFGFPTFVSLMAYSQVALGLAGARRILELIKRETRLDENAGGYQGVIKGEIRFENVSFGYVEGMDVLEEISFTAAPGETVAIVGQTASGKSSLAKLINRTYDVRHGRVLVDDMDVRDWNLAALRQQISIIEQDIFLFSRTIAENIAFGNASATQAEIEGAAKAAQAHDFILDFADGYQTIIGERGVTLSGGQRQRLALARAFLTRPRILILDDSTSAIDSATEDRIQQAIEHAAAGQTTILITHRLSQIRWADQVILLRQGRMVAAGDHETLLNQSAAYRRIFEQYQQ
jgi:ATP-binding cassette, subfamily B, bacterial